MIELLLHAPVSSLSHSLRGRESTTDATARDALHSSRYGTAYVSGMDEPLPDLPMRCEARRCEALLSILRWSVSRRIRRLSLSLQRCNACVGPQSRSRQSVQSGIYEALQSWACSSSARAERGGRFTGVAWGGELRHAGGQAFPRPTRRWRGLIGLLLEINCD
jgi:hypothetical protein